MSFRKIPGHVYGRQAYTGVAEAFGGGVPTECPTCKSIEEAVRDGDLVKADELVKRHPKCHTCGLLLGERHLAQQYHNKDLGGRVCQFCDQEFIRFGRSGFKGCHY